MVSGVYAGRRLTSSIRSSVRNFGPPMLRNADSVRGVTPEEPNLGAVHLHSSRRHVMYHRLSLT